jgi:hypothetical protein
VQPNMSANDPRRTLRETPPSEPTLMGGLRRDLLVTASGLVFVLGSDQNARGESQCGRSCTMNTYQAQALEKRNAIVLRARERVVQAGARDSLRLEAGL